MSKPTHNSYFSTKPLVFLWQTDRVDMIWENGGSIKFQQSNVIIVKITIVVILMNLYQFNAKIFMWIKFIFRFGVIIA